MMFGQKMQYMSESMFMLNFPNVSVAVKNGIMRMMSFMGSSCFCSTKSSRLKNGACFEVGGRAGVWHSLNWLIQVRYGLLNIRS